MAEEKVVEGKEPEVLVSEEVPEEKPNVDDNDDDIVEADAEPKKDSKRSKTPEKEDKQDKEDDSGTTPEEKVPPPPPKEDDSEQQEKKKKVKEEKTSETEKRKSTKSKKEKSRRRSKERSRRRRRRSRSPRSRRKRSRDRSRRSKEKGKDKRRSSSRDRRRKRKRSSSKQRSHSKERKKIKREKVKRERRHARVKRETSTRKVKIEVKRAVISVKKPKKELPVLTEAQKKENARQLLEAQIKAASEGVNAQITRPARKLYVGNLPTDMGLTEKMLVQFFTACLGGLGIRTELPIMSAWINGDQTFAFIECRSVQDATLALTLCDGLALGGRQLRFGRPVDYKLPAKHLLCYCVGGPEPVGEVDVPYTMPNVADNTPAYHLAKALMKQETGSDPTPSILVPAAPKSNKSRVLCLENCVNESMISKNEDYIDIIEDIKEECETFGKLLQLVIPRRGADPCGFNRVFLRYEKQSGADKCRLKVNNREFGEGKVNCGYFAEDLFKSGEWDQDVNELDDDKKNEVVLTLVGVNNDTKKEEIPV